MVSLTQLRNLLTGTRPQNNPLAAPNVAPNNNLTTDSNFVMRDGLPYWMPNNVPDGADGIPSGSGGPSYRQNVPVAGRWGDEGHVPLLLPQPPAGALSLGFSTVVAPGRANALTQGGTPTGVPPWGATAAQVNPYWDSADDDLDADDPYPAAAEGADYFDAAGALAIPSERNRRAVKPLDNSGNGRVVGWRQNPAGPDDYGTGADNFGRVGFFHYFRPPGLPGQVTYPGNNFAVPAVVAYPPVIDPLVMGEVTNNLFHGYDAEQNPAGSMAGTPWQWAARPYNVADALTVPSVDPTINPINSFPLPANRTTVTNGHLMGSLARDNANEMNLYGPQQVRRPLRPPPTWSGSTASRTSMARRSTVAWRGSPPSAS